ncbi:MAG: IclR family transcriptional regulator, partial [Pseudorhodobacter sp.]
MSGEKPMRRKSSPRPESRGVQSIETGARLLETLAAEMQPMMLKDLAKMAGFVPAQAHAYLVSYRKVGLVEQDAKTGHYKLGRFALDLGIASMRTTDPFRVASEAAIELSELTALHVALVVWGSFGATVVQVQESGGQINMSTLPGTVYSLTGTASGRVFAAFLPETIIKASMSREKRERADSGRIGVARFMSRAEIAHIREVGYATVESPPVPGVSAYSAPIFDNAGQLIM